MVGYLWAWLGQFRKEAGSGEEKRSLCAEHLLALKRYGETWKG